MKFWSEKNKLDPKEIRRRTAIQNVIWECKKCNYEWEISPHAFSGYRGCPKCDTGSRVSKMALDWLNFVDVDAIPEQKIIIENRYMYVDGYNYKTNKVYEFLGDYWHGNPEKYNLSDLNSTCDKSFGELYKITIDRINTIINAGYNLTYIWEAEWKAIRNS